MILTKTWNEMITNERTKISEIIDSYVIAEGTQIDTLFNTKYGINTEIANALNLVKDDYLTDGGIWEDLPIYLSSYKENDRRLSLHIKDNLKRYIRFYTKMITDDGLAKRIVINRTFENTTEGESTDKNIYSETPSIELDNFEEGIKYASNLSQNSNDNTLNASGENEEISKTTTWEEELKNVRFAFYNDLIDYIEKIPNLLYEYYALDSRPAKELIKATHEYFKTIIRL